MDKVYLGIIGLVFFGYLCVAALKVGDCRLADDNNVQLFSHSEYVYTGTMTCMLMTCNV